MCTCLYDTHVKIFLHALDGSAYHSGLVALCIPSLQGMDYSLRTDIAQDLLCPAESWQRAKSEYVEAQSGLLPSEGRVGSEDMLLAQLLGMLSLPTPSQPLAVRAGPRLFCSLRRSTGSWRVGKADLSQSDPIHPYFLHACLIIGH